MDQQQKPDDYKKNTAPSEYFYGVLHRFKISVKNQCRENKSWSQWLSLEDQPPCCFKQANAFIFLAKKKEYNMKEEEILLRCDKQDKRKGTLFTTFCTAGQQIK
jgi:hypothetical protein